MKLITALILTLILALIFNLTQAHDIKTVDANGKKIEARVPKSAKIDCKVNAEKTECKAPTKTMPKVEKPKESAPADAKPAKK